MKNMSLKLTRLTLTLFAQLAFSQTPSIDAIVSPADYTAGPASPGGVIVIFGSNLAAAKSAPAAPFPATVSGVNVKIGSSQAPLEYAMGRILMPSQIPKSKRAASCAIAARKGKLHCTAPLLSATNK